MPSDGTTPRTPLRKARWTPPALWLALILIGTSWPGVSVGPDDMGLDKVAHFTAYAVLSALVLRATRTPFAWSTALRVIVAISVLGALDEWHQAFIPRRSTSLLDWVADTLGAIVGVLAVRYVPFLRPKRLAQAS